MKQIRSALVLLAITCVVMPPTAPLFGQEWSPAQKEVWKTMETMWDMYAKGNVEGEFSYIDDDFTGWFPDEGIPSGKASMKKWVTYDSKTMQVLLHDLNPAAIKIFGDVAVVHYFITIVSKRGTNEESGVIHYTDIFKKKGDKWVLIATHGSYPPRAK